MRQKGVFLAIFRPFERFLVLWLMPQQGLAEPKTSWHAIRILP
jgi:hypothetical protein